MGENRVLTLDEVLALGDGAEVWVEMRTSNRFDGAHIKRHTTLENDMGDIEICDESRRTFEKRWRVWSLPQPPTHAELAANPWPAQ